VENLLQHYTFSNGSLTDVNDNIIDVIIIYIGSTLGEIAGTKSSRVLKYIVYKQSDPCPIISAKYCLLTWRALSVSYSNFQREDVLLSCANLLPLNFCKRDPVPIEDF
jgi:hypothetical protein